MDPVTRCLVCFGLLLQGLLLAETTSPPEGFKFNCGHDICVFPRDFCNIGKQRCDVCTLDVCNELNVSSQCGQRCKELKGEEEIPKTEGPSEELLSTLIGQVTTLTYVVWILVALLSPCILFCIVKHVIACRNRSRDKNTDEGSISQRYQQLPGRDDDTDVNSDHVNPTAPPQQLVMSGPIGSSVSVYQPSPSGQGGNDSSRGNHRILPETIPESPADSRPKVDLRQQHPVDEHHVSDMGDFHLLDGDSLTTPKGVDPDATVVKTNNPCDWSDDIEVVPDDIDGQAPLSSRPCVNSCPGMVGAYTDTHVRRTVPKVSSQKSIISSTSRGSDSGNYTSTSSSDTDNIAMEKRSLVNEDNTLTANV
ncbi:uncharacterized protein LOC110463250 [Mizuhopecten yessoensis]|uniref:TNFR-Cys domain-containing protein n=1 Tax=Mizuhopecten yessoensis TaxID=6573 RepID=A0A210PWN1_MIZYE|nr:uncharacterized protein LOC110463250 [Mizuhopecten yessoensis]OWF40862.1 hypothetical protein KP79_PYT06136 [Mizuhopecten yessoensis]